MNKVDYIIVGMGLAGACMATQLLRLNKKVVVYDLPDINRASAVAAGLYNPITGRGIVKTWLADKLFPYLKTFYSSVEKGTGVKLLFEIPLYIPFCTIEEQNEWMTKSSDSSFDEYIIDITSASISDQVHDPLGGILLSNCGYVDVPRFLDHTRNALRKFNFYREEKFLEEEMKVHDNFISYKNVEAIHIIFCQGIEQLQSTYFNELPLKPLKGEVLNIRVDETLDHIYNRGIYILETEKFNCKVGATYELENLSHEVTNKAKYELVRKTENLLKVPFKVSHQDWGIRPSTVDRRPLIGVHPNHKNIWIFNGLGTKGVSLAPYFSAQLAQHMEGLEDLDKEANITRVKSLYSKF